MAGPASTNDDIDQIRREMAQIRHDLHFDVQQTVEGVRSLTDVTSYIRNAPWLSIGLAMAVGFIVVPRRKRPEAGVAMGLLEHPTPTPVAEAPGRKSSLVKAAFGLLAPIAVRAAQNYAMHAVESFLATNHAVPPAPSAEPRTETSRPQPAAPRDAGPLD